MTPEQYWSGLSMPWSMLHQELDRLIERQSQRTYAAVASKILYESCWSPSGDNWHSPDAAGPTGL